VLIFLEGASRSPENCLADPKTVDPSLRTTDLECWKCARTRFHCANCLVVLRSCAP